MKTIKETNKEILNDLLNDCINLRVKVDNLIQDGYKFNSVSSYIIDRILLVENQILDSINCINE